MGAVALLTGVAEPALASGTGLMGAGAVGTRLVAAPAGVTEVVMGLGTGDVIDGGGTGAVSSFGCVRPAPGRARNVMRTVSFFRGTAAVFWTGLGGGCGAVLSSDMAAKSYAEAGAAASISKKISRFPHFASTAFSESPRKTRPGGV